MTLNNFRVAEDFIGLKFGDNYLDLHNCYDIEGFEYYNDSQEFRLKFKKGAQGKIHDLDRFQLVFKRVSFLRVGERNNEMSESDDNCLEFIGFLPYESRDIMDGFLTHMPKTQTDDMVINTYTGQSIKLQSETVKFQIMDNEK